MGLTARKSTYCKQGRRYLHDCFPITKRNTKETVESSKMEIDKKQTSKGVEGKDLIDVDMENVNNELQWKKRN